MLFLLFKWTLGVFIFLWGFHHSGLLYLIISAYFCEKPRSPVKIQDLLSSRRKVRKGLNAVLLGGTGGIGRQIARSIANSSEFKSLVIIVRKPVDLHSLLGTKFSKPSVSQVVVNFSKLEEEKKKFAGFDTAFYSLGVYAGNVSIEKYLSVEKEQALKIAAILRQGGCKDVHWVTAIGTSVKSPLIFGRVKAEVEKTLAGMGFHRITFYRPGGVLTTDNSGLFGVTRIRLWRYFLRHLDVLGLFSVNGADLSCLMVELALREGEGLQVLQNWDINRMAKELIKNK